jgi:hypothetical protein
MKTKVHTVYKRKTGNRVPGVTTILNEMAKPALIHWAWDLGCKGVDYRKFRDEKAEIGTLLHYMVLCHLKNEKPELKDYTSNQIDLAENCMISYLEWEKLHPLKPLVIEEPLVSEEWGFGGTPDLLAEMNGDICLIDFKTGKAIYDEYFYQLSAYRQLIVENTETEGFNEAHRLDLGDEFSIFLSCLDIYETKKRIKRKK